MISKVLKKYHNEEFVKEIEAISTLVEIPFFDMFLVNFAYELGSIFNFLHENNIFNFFTNSL